MSNSLHLHTSHMPSEDPEFGDVIAQYHENGWLVYVDENSKVNDWLEPIMKTAIEQDKIFINFDSKQKVNNKFKTFTWK